MKLLSQVCFDHRHVSNVRMRSYFIAIGVALPLNIWRVHRLPISSPYRLSPVYGNPDLHLHAVCTKCCMVLSDVLLSCKQWLFCDSVVIGMWGRVFQNVLALFPIPAGFVTQCEVPNNGPMRLGLKTNLKTQ